MTCSSAIAPNWSGAAANGRRSSCRRSAAEGLRRRSSACHTAGMNYRHEFHAGNFADVVKHAVLARIVSYLREKPAPFRVIDTHAGAGLYDLGGSEAARTGEWREGIGRLLAAQLAPEIRALLSPYLEAVAALNPGGG